MAEISKPWGVAVIGAAGWYAENHLKAWQAHGANRAEIVALCDLNAERLRERAAQFGVSPDHCFTTLADLLTSPLAHAVDIIDIVTRPGLHPELVTQAAQAGKAILCQKPFAETIEAAQFMVDTAKNADVRLMVTENWRCYAPLQKIKAILAAGTLGQIQTVRWSHKNYATPLMVPDAPINQPFFREMPRLLFFEMAPHWFDTWRFLFGTPRRLYAEVGKASPYTQGEDSGIVTLSHDDFYGFCDMSWASRENRLNAAGNVQESFRETLVIEGSDATLTLTPTGRATPGSLRLVSGRQADRETILDAHTTYDAVAALEAAQSHFLHGLETGEPLQTSGSDNLHTLRMVFAVYESVRTRQAVVL